MTKKTKTSRKEPLKSVPANESLAAGDAVVFAPLRRGNVRNATVVETDMVLVLLEGDPFPVPVKKTQLSSCKDSEDAVLSTTSARRQRAKPKEKEVQAVSDAKELRLKAQAAGVVGWEKMGRKELAKAIEAKQSKNGKSSKAESTDRPRTKAKAEAEAPKTKKGKKAKKGKVSESPKSKVKASKKAKRGETKADKGEAVTPSQKAKANGKATKTVTKAATAAKTTKATKTGDGITLPKGATAYEPTEENPFRQKSNLFLVAKLLLRGGKRRTLAEKLSAQIDLHPYKGGDTELLDFDKRLLLGAQTMRDKHGYGIQRVGRGLDGTIKVFVPGGPNDPRNSTNGKGKVAKSKSPAKVG